MDVVHRFVLRLVRDDEVGDALHDLVDDAADLLGVAGAGISLARDGGLAFATAADERVTFLERLQEETQSGPCVEAHRAGTAVMVADLRADPHRWPALARAAADAGVVAVAGIPVHLNGAHLGALDLYDDHPRAWSDDLEVAELFAAMAAAYVANAARLDEARHIAEQLQEALTSRVVIEQAKGVLAGERGISVDEAFAVLRSHARRKRVSLRAVADAIVNLGLRP